jgi:putative SOS response-associated peptidase YedK
VQIFVEEWGDFLQASESVCEIHHRMPAILRPENYEAWFDPINLDVDELENILLSGIVTVLVSHTVSKSVNSDKNNEPSNYYCGN